MGVKISELAEAMSANNSDVLPIVQDGETKRISKENFLKNLLPTTWSTPALTSYITGDIRYARIGNIVFVMFSDVQVRSALSHNVVLATGLPASTDYIVTSLMNFDMGNPMRLAVNQSGELVAHYSINSASTNVYYGTLIYITNQ
jgi:hypothetical protein